MDNEIKKRLSLLAKGRTPTAFARHCGVPQRSMAGWLDKKSTTQPNIENLLKIAKACGVSVGWLAAGEGESGLIGTESTRSRATLTHNQPYSDAIEDAEQAKKLREDLTKAIKVKARIEPGSKATGGGYDLDPITGDMKLSDLLTLTARVLESNTVYAPALAANVKAFAAAVASEAEIDTLRRQNMEMSNSMAALEERMAELEKRLDKTTGSQAAG